MNKHMKIVVIGGSGLIGTKLVNNLRPHGHEVVAASPSSGAYPREIFRPVIVHAAAGFVLVHNHPCGATPYPVVRRTQRKGPSDEAPLGAA